MKARHDASLILKEGRDLDRDPIAAQEAIPRGVFNWDGGGQHLEFLEIGAVVLGFETGQLDWKP